MMERQAAVALVMYMQRAVAIVPTTGAEWDAIRSILRTVEMVANGQATVEVHDGAQQVKANGRDTVEEHAALRAAQA